jgi:hypothetical protein
MPDGAVGVLQGSTAITIRNTTADLVSATGATGGISWKTLKTDGRVWTGSPFNTGTPFSSGTHRGFTAQVWSTNFSLPCATQAAGVTATSVHTARWKNLQGDRGETNDEKRCAPPRPHFTMSTSSQQSGDGATLTISAGHSLSLQSTTADFGEPAAAPSALTWILDQSQIATGSGTSLVPPHGTHTVWLSLTNDSGQGEVTGTVVVVPPDLADSCDNPVTDVVETNCGGQGGGYQYGVGGGSVHGTQYCWEIDHYEYDPNTNTIDYLYTETVYCWAME